MPQEVLTGPSMTEVRKREMTEKQARELDLLRREHQARASLLANGLDSTGGLSDQQPIPPSQSGLTSFVNLGPVDTAVSTACTLTTSTNVVSMTQCCGQRRYGV